MKEINDGCSANDVSFELYDYATEEETALNGSVRISDI